MKRGMETIDGQALFSDVQVAALRMSIAGLVLLPFSIYFIRRLKSWKELLSFAIVGFTGNFIPAFLFTYAETGISSGFAGMLNSFTPVFTIIIGGIIFKQRLTSIQFAGAIVAAIGIVLLMVAGKSLSISGTWFNILAVVFATLLYGISLNTIKHKLHAYKAIEITSLAFICVVIPGVFIALGSGTIETIKTVPHALQGLGYICILSFVGTVIALVLHNRLIAMSSALFASSVTYFIPIVAVFIGFGFGERINMYQIASMGIVLSGVFVANYWSLLRRVKA
jgi:drug/metabolite transporter (DMT)-like permease